MFGNATRSHSSHRHFYPIRIQDFHKFARFFGASAMKHRTRSGNAPWKYSAVTSRSCITHGWFAEFWRIFATKKLLLPLLFDATRLVYPKAKDRSLLTNPFLSSWEKNDQSSRLHAVGRSDFCRVSIKKPVKGL